MAVKDSGVGSIAGMTPLGIHHVGVAVTDLDAAIATYVQTLGATFEHRQVIESQGVEAASVVLGSGRVELLAPTDHDTPVGRFLARRGPACTTSPTRSPTSGRPSASSLAAGVQLIDEQPRPGLFGLEVAFIHPDAVHGVLTEVVSHG